MNIARFSVKNSLFINLVSVFLVIAGFLSLLQLKREAFPEVDFNTVFINTYYRGASPEDVEKLVTVPIETELKEVEGIEEVNSASREGTSMIIVEIDPDADDKDKVVNDIQKAVDRVTALPAGVEDRPVVTEITSGQIPVIKVAMSGDIDEFHLQELVDQLEDSLEDIEGVAAVDLQGYRDQEYWVEADIEKMRQMHVSFDEIIAALASRNVSIPAGKMETADGEFRIKTLGEFTSKEEIETVIIRGNDLGNWLRVKDVARVRHTFRDETQINKVYGSRSVTLVVRKKDQGDAVDVVDRVEAELARFQETAPEGLNISTYDDLSFYIKRRLNVLQSNGVIGFFLVLAILFVFLHPAPAFFTALGIPIAMFSTFWVMSILGLSINLMSMFGLIVVLGMLVDDGIIITENVYRHIEDGLSPRQAAVTGTMEVAAPVTATVITTIAAFLPLMFMTGIIGQFVMNIPLIVIIALLASMVEVFIILPSHLADFVKTPKKTFGKKEKPQKESHFFQVILKWYARILEKALNRRYLVAGIMFLALIGAVFFARFGMKFVLFPSQGIEQFQLYAEAEVGTSLEEMNRLIEPLGKLVSAMPEKHLDMFETNIGILSESSGIGDPSAKYGSHLAMITVYLTPIQERSESAAEIMAVLRTKLEKIRKQQPELERVYLNELDPGPPVGKPVDIKVRGDDFRILRNISSDIKDYLEKLNGVMDVRDSYELANPEFRIVVDKEKAAQAGISVRQVASTLRYAFEGGIATTIKPVQAEDEINVLVRLPEDQRNDRQIFSRIMVPNQRQNLVPLTKIAGIETGQGIRTINHLNGKRYVAVTADVDNQQMTSLRANTLIQERFGDIARKYPGYSLNFGGEQEETVKSLNSLLAAFGIAFLLIFMVLATEFNSLVQPFIVLLSIPLALIGVVIALFIHGEPISFLAILGVVGLAGIVVNDSIVLVAFINNLRRKGIDRRYSITEAGRIRLRPVILTTLTTVAGLSTVAYGIGGFDPFLRPMALSISWGLLFGSGLTLIVLPCFYAIIDDITLKITAHPTVQRINRKRQKEESAE